MALFLDQPVVVPAAPEKEYPICWIRTLQINAHDPTGEGQISLEMAPMSFDRQLHFPGATVVSTDTLYQAMAEVPELRDAFVAILNAVKPLQSWIAQQQEAG